MNDVARRAHVDPPPPRIAARCRRPAAGFGILTAASFAPIISVLVVNLIKEAVLKLIKTRREAGGRVQPSSE